MRLRCQAAMTCIFRQKLSHLMQKFCYPFTDCFVYAKPSPAETELAAQREIFMKTKPFKPGVIVQTDVRSLRVAAGLTQERAAERFNLSLRSWQLKEAVSNPGLLSQGEYELLLLLADKHPDFILASR